MGIFDEPKRLAKLLASVNTHSSIRPLSPIETAQWLQEGVTELGDKQEVMQRVDIGKSMWSAFEKLLTIPEEIENVVCWGKSNPETLQIGFSVAHYLAEGLKPSEQIMLVNKMWDMDRPYATDEIKRIKSYYRSNPKKSLEDAITHILKIDRPLKKEIIFMFISEIKKNTYEKLKKAASEANIPLNKFTTQIILNFFSENSVTNTKIHHNMIRITFSEEGEKEFKNGTKTKNISKNDIIRHIFKEAGFA